MSTIGLLIGVLLVSIVVVYAVLPLFLREESDANAFRNKQRERALAYYERVLRNIRDLDDDLATNKISQSEYDVERERWMARGVELLHMLEQLDNDINITGNLMDEANDADIDAAIEQAISDVREQTTAAGLS